MKKAGKTGGGGMLRLAAFIVDRRNLIFLLTIILMVFSVFSSGWVEVEESLATYLPEDSMSRQALDKMEEEFVTYGSARVMVANISQQEAELLSEELAGLKGVQSVEFDSTEAHYTQASALFSVTFEAEEEDEACLTALERVKTCLEDYDVYVDTDLGNPTEEIINTEIRNILLLSAAVILAVLLLTCRSFGEVPVVLLTFLCALVINRGTNFLLGKISYVSNSVTAVLQLALSLDYAIILSNRFRLEHESLPIREAAIRALACSLPSICASSLTTIGGLAAMVFMQFKIGTDMAICLIKSILFAMLSVFLLMPGLLVLFGKLIDRTRHRSLVPRISFAGRFAWVSRGIVPLLFTGVVVFAVIYSGRCPMVYDYSRLSTPRTNEITEAEQIINDTFGRSDVLAVLVPTGDYEEEAALLEDLEELAEVTSATGLANTEALSGYMLSDALTAREFSELTYLDYELAELVYGAYAVKQGDYTQILGQLSSYRVPLIDMFLFALEQADTGLVDLPAAQLEQLAAAKEPMERAARQLKGEHYSRLVLTLDREDDEAPGDLVDRIRELAEKHYPEGTVYLAGDATSEYDFRESYSRDNVVVSLVSILIVLVVLLFTFRSAGMPLLLILVIQGAIWINFAIPTLTDDPIFFMSYLVVSAIQMGANIDYAIVIAGRYEEEKTRLPRQEAIIETLNFAFPTILTSGSILVTAGFLVGYCTSEPTIAGIGQTLYRGTLIAMALVFFVLPQLLLIGGNLVDKTSFRVKDLLDPDALEKGGGADEA